MALLMLQRLTALGVSLVLLSLGAGCANPPLYIEHRDKQAQDAKKAVAEVDLVAAVDQLRTKFEALSQLEAQTQKARSARSRELVIASLANPPDQYSPEVSVQDRYVARLLDKRLTALGGDEAASQVVNELERQAASKLRVLSVKANEKIDSCSAAAAKKEAANPFAQLPAGQQMVAKVLLDDAVAFCEKVRAASKVQPMAKGEISELLEALKKEEEGIATRVRLAKDARDQLDSAAADALKEADGKSPAELLADAAGRFQKLLDGIKGLAAPGTDDKANKEAEATARFEALDKVLKALSSGKADLSDLDAEEKRAVLIVRFIPSLATEVEGWMKERTRIRAAPLLIAKENQRLADAGFKAELQVLQRRAQIRGRMLASAQGEHLALTRAKHALGKDASLLNRPLTEVLDKGSPKERFRVYTSLTHFDDAEDYRQATELARLELDESAVDLAMVASRSAAAQWSNLAASIAAVLGDYHGQGVKPDTLAEFFKAVGLAGIAAK